MSAVAFGAEGAEEDPVPSTTPDVAFRWSATDRQWIYNIATRGWGSGLTYYFRIALKDGTTIDFALKLK